MSEGNPYETDLDLQMNTEIPSDLFVYKAPHWALYYLCGC